MIITLIAHEKNLGVLTLTDFILETLGKDNCAVVGSNYLVNNNTQVLNSILKFKEDNKNVIIKYMIPKQKFSNQDIVYPAEFEYLSDVVVRVPKFIEEVTRPVQVEALKGQGNPLLDKIYDYYH